MECASASLGVAFGGSGGWLIRWREFAGSVDKRSVYA